MDTLPSDDHARQWLARYGSDYATNAERVTAYQLHQTTLADMRAVFGMENE